MLLKTALAPHRLEIEVPECVFEREMETLPVIQAVRQLGVRVTRAEHPQPVVV